MLVMMMKKQTCVRNPTSSELALGMQKNSQTISKAKPSIRIIHIYAPEIIKTDVANFRELVQRLTGKPTSTHRRKSSSKRKSTNIIIPLPTKEDYSISALSNNKPMNITKKMEFRERIKQEEEEILWGTINGDHENSNISGGGFLGGFADLDGFMQELGGFPLLPLDASHMGAFGEIQLPSA